MNSDRIPPIDVLWYEAPNSGNNYFFSMGDCHRWEYVEMKIVDLKKEIFIF